MSSLSTAKVCYKINPKFERILDDSIRLSYNSLCIKKIKDSSNENEKNRYENLKHLFNKGKKLDVQNQCKILKNELQQIKNDLKRIDKSNDITVEEQLNFFVDNIGYLNAKEYGNELENLLSLLQMEIQNRVQAKNRKQPSVNVKRGS